MPSRKRNTRSLLAVLLTLGLLGPSLFAQTTAKKQVSAQGSAKAVDDPEFARLVKEWTTRPDFISPLVDHLP